MQKKTKKTYRFAISTSIAITFVLTLLTSVFFYKYHIINWEYILLFASVCILCSFIIIQTRIDYFIYRRIKQIYDDLSLLDSSNFTKESVTSDMATLTEELDKYAKNKKLEIEMLKVREQYRKEFLGNVSHELKTPLFTIQGYILTLLEGNITDEKIKDKYLLRASKGVERLSYIVKDLDMITKLEVGDLSLNIIEFDILDLVRNVFDLLEMRASKKKIVLTFDVKYNEPVLVKADKERIQQVLTNLIINAIKYGRENGTVEISVENLVKNKVIIRVTDNGEGIDKEHLPRLFERFYRVDKSGSRAEGGSGLGLSIVKHIIEAHDEKIYIESELEVGSEFSFTLEKA